MQKMIGWFRMYGRSTQDLSDFKHYVAIYEGSGLLFARCGMIEGGVELGFWKNLFARKCRKCMVSEQADRKRIKAHAAGK